MEPCFHSMTPALNHPDYEVCVKCGTFHSLCAPQPEQVYTSDYWSHEKGRSTLDEQVYNCETHLENGISKNQAILSAISVEQRTAALDIGCAPGSLLGSFYRDAGFEWVCGIECIPDSKADILRIAATDAATVVLGVFPKASQSYSGLRFDLIVASDVFEHAHSPWLFLQECARLLKMDGQLILVVPLVTDDLPDRMFNAVEHVWLHNLENLSAMMEQAGLSVDYVGRWCPGHEIVSAKRVGTPIASLNAA